MRTILVTMLLLAGCSPLETNSNGVPCTGVRLPMSCDCVISCVATTEQVLVEWRDDEGCEPLCYAPSDAPAGHR